MLTTAFPALGEVLTVTRNAHVILAEYGTYPVLRPRADGLAAADDEGRIFADFTRWRDAEAREEPVCLGEGGGDSRESLFSLTFRDLTGDAFHRVCLLPRSDLPRFHALVREHGTGSRAASSAPGVAADAVSRSGAGGEIVAMQRTRLPALLARAGRTGRCGCGRPGCIDDVHPLKLPPAMLPTILRRTAQDTLPLRATLFQPGIVHTARFTPAQLPAGEPGDGWLFFHDESVGLHLRPDGIAALWFTLPAAGSGGESCLEAYDARGELLAAFAPAHPAQDEGRWRSLVWSR